VNGPEIKPTIEDFAHWLMVAIDRISLELPEFIEGPAGQMELCELLHAIRQQRIRLAEIEATVEAKAARSMGPADRIEWPGYLAERKGGAVRKHWDHKLLAARVSAQIGVDPDSGEFADADEVVQRLLDFAAISYWRTSKLRAADIPFDDAVDTERGRRTVHVTKGRTP
jgi:hypothetical protein